MKNLYKGMAMPTYKMETKICLACKVEQNNNDFCKERKHVRGQGNHVRGSWLTMGKQ